jgi:N-acyl-D-amino-acid deacylase
MQSNLCTLLFAVLVACTMACQTKPTYDTIISQGMIYDGSGGKPIVADIGILNDTIAAIGDLSKATSREVVNANGKAVAPGFINMMGHSEESLFADGRGQSDIRQGVTLEVFCEMSFGPLNEQMKKQLQEGQGDIKYPVNWNTLGEYMQQLEKKGISPNIASYVGAGTIRTHVLGEGKVAPSPDQLKQMQSMQKAFEGSRSMFQGLGGGQGGSGGAAGNQQAAGRPGPRSEEDRSAWRKRARAS